MYSVTIIVLAAVLFESNLSRIRYLERDTSKKSVVEYFATINPDAELVEAIREVFTVREAIVHNHVWIALIDWDKGNIPKFVKRPIFHEGYGDKRFREVLDRETLCSRRLTLNLVPSRIWRHDVYIVLKIVGEALRSQKSKDPACIGLIEGRLFKFKNQTFTFNQIIAALGAEET